MGIRKTVGAGLVLAVGLLLGEAVVRPAQVVQAADWEWFISNQEVYCEGCCTPGLLCCTVGFPCRTRVQPS